MWPALGARWWAVGLACPGALEAEAEARGCRRYFLMVKLVMLHASLKRLQESTGTWGDAALAPPSGAHPSLHVCGSHRTTSLTWFLLPLGNTNAQMGSGETQKDKKKMCCFI